VAVRRTQAVQSYLAATRELQAKITDLQNQINALAAQVDAAPPERRVSVNAGIGPQRDLLFSEQGVFQQQLNQLQVSARLTSGGAQVVTRALTPTTPVKPRPARSAVLGLAVGLMLGAGAAFLFEYLDDSIKTKADLERATHGRLPTLGLIPALSGWRDRDDARLVSLIDPGSGAAEAYRALRTTVQFMALGRPTSV